MIRLTLAANAARLSAKTHRILQPETQSYINAMDIPPEAEIQWVYDNLFSTLIKTNIWPKLACLQLYYTAHTEQAALLNAIDPSKTGIAVNNPAFTVKLGYTTDGVTSYIRTGFTPVDNGTVYSRNNAFLGYAMYDFDLNNGRHLGRSTYQINDGSIYIYTEQDGNGKVSINGLVPKVFGEGSINNDTRFLACTRQTAETLFYMIDGAYVGPVENASAEIGVITGDMTDIILGGSNVNGTFADGKVVYPSAFWAGNFVNASEWLVFQAALVQYFIEMGAV